MFEIMMVFFFTLSYGFVGIQLFWTILLSSF